MDCIRAAEQISARLDRELGTAEGAELDTHLEQCAACRTLADELFAVRCAFDMELVAAPDTLIPLVLREIRPKRMTAPWRRLGVTAALFAVAVTGAWAMRAWVPERAPEAVPSESVLPMAALVDEAAPSAGRETAPEAGQASSAGGTPEAVAMNPAVLPVEGVTRFTGRKESDPAELSGGGEAAEDSGGTANGKENGSGSAEPVPAALQSTVAIAADDLPKQEAQDEETPEIAAFSAAVEEGQGDDALEAVNVVVFYTATADAPLGDEPEGDVVVFGSDPDQSRPPSSPVRVGRAFRAVTLTRAEAEGVLRVWLGDEEAALDYLGTLSGGGFYCFEKVESGAVYAVSAEGQVVERGTPEGEELLADWSLDE